MKMAKPINTADLCLTGCSSAKFSKIHSQRSLVGAGNGIAVTATAFVLPPIESFIPEFF